MEKAPRVLALVAVACLLSYGVVSATIYPDVWTQERSGGSDLNSVSAIDHQQAWAVGNNGAVLKRTAAGGWEWVNINIINQAEYDFHGVCFVNENRGWIVGEKNWGGFDKRTGIVLYYNGNWWDQTDNVDWDPGLPEAPTPFLDVHFANLSAGWVSCGNNYVLRTINSGTDWLVTTVTSELEVPDYLSHCFNGVWSADGQKAWAISDTKGYIGKTTNAGEDWTIYDPFGANYVVPDAVWPSPPRLANHGLWGTNFGTIYLGLSDGKVGKTANEGQTWSTQTVQEFPQWTRGVWFEGSDRWAVGTSGTIAFSRDNGTSWDVQHYNFTYDLNDVAFGEPYDEENHFGWAVGTGGQILRDTTRAATGLSFRYELNDPQVNIEWEVDPYPDPTIDYFRVYRCFGKKHRGDPYDKVFPIKDFTEGTGKYRWEGDTHTYRVAGIYYWYTVDVVYEDLWVHRWGPFGVTSVGNNHNPPWPALPHSVAVEDVAPDQGGVTKITWSMNPGDWDKCYIYRGQDEDALHHLIGFISYPSPCEFYDYSALTERSYHYVVKSWTDWNKLIRAADNGASGKSEDNVPPDQVSPTTAWGWWDDDEKILHVEWGPLTDDPTLGGYWFCPKPPPGQKDYHLNNTAPIRRTWFKTHLGWTPSAGDRLEVAVCAMDRSAACGPWLDFFITADLALCTTGEATGFSHGHRFLRDQSTGKLHLAYTSHNDAPPDEAELHVYYRHSSDGGSTWTAKEAVGEGGYASLGLEGSGKPNACWLKDTPDESVVYYARRQGDGEAPWTTPYELLHGYKTGQSSTTYSAPAHRVDDAGVVQLVVERTSWNEGVCSWALLYGTFLASNPGAVQWEAVDSESPYYYPWSLSQASPSISVDAWGKPYVCWSRDGEIYAATKDGDEWSTMNVSQSPTCHSKDCSIELEDGVGHFVWSEETTPGGGDYDILHRAYKYFPPPQEWVTPIPENVSNSTAVSESPVFAGDFVSWHEGTGNLTDIYFSRQIGPAWSTPENVSDSDAECSRYPQMVYIGELPSLYVAQVIWTEGRESCYGVTIKTITYSSSPEEGGSQSAQASPSVPRMLSLFQNRPNPVGSSTEIGYGIPARCGVKLSVYDAAGQLVTVLVNGMQDMGHHTAHWKGTDSSGRPVSSGIYFYRLEAGDPELAAAEVFAATRKLVVLR